MSLTYLLPDEAATTQLAAQLAPLLEQGDVILLQGTLGMGKSTFARALVRSYLGQPGLEVPSPTFTLLQTYEGDGFPLYHFDLYRLESPHEMEELGFDEALLYGVSLIEWPERLGTKRLRQTLRLVLTDQPTEGRQVTLEGDDWWQDRLDTLDQTRRGRS